MSRDAVIRLAWHSPRPRWWPFSIVGPCACPGQLRPEGRKPGVWHAPSHPLSTLSAHARALGSDLQVFTLGLTTAHENLHVKKESRETLHPHKGRPSQSAETAAQSIVMQHLKACVKRSPLRPPRATTAPHRSERRPACCCAHGEPLPKIESAACGARVRTVRYCTVDVQCI